MLKIFNPKESEVHNFAQVLKGYFEEMFNLLQNIKSNSNENESKKKEVDDLIQMKKKEFEIAIQEVELLKAKKLEIEEEDAKIPMIRHSRVLSTFIEYEERKNLYEMFQTLDPLYMRGVYKLIEDEMPNELKKYREDDNEIYLNMDDMESITLRKLEAYVYECLGKRKETATPVIKEKIMKDTTILKEETKPTIPAPPKENQMIINNMDIEQEKEESSESQSSSESDNDSSSSESSEEDNDHNNLFISTKPIKKENGLIINTEKTNDITNTDSFQKVEISKSHPHDEENKLLQNQLTKTGSNSIKEDEKIFQMKKESGPNWREISVNCKTTGDNIIEERNQMNHVIVNESLAY